MDIISFYGIRKKETEHYFLITTDQEYSRNTESKVEKNSNCVRLKANDYQYYFFVNICIESKVYRQLVKINLNKIRPNVTNFTLFIILIWPSYHYIDYKWDSILLQMLIERRELENAMAWLSTLGGAFSALGDYTVSCALLAGKISAKQINLAFKLGDPSMISRCYLYLAISLLQRKFYKKAQSIIREQYKIAKYQLRDNRVIKMCLGIWSKLVYEKQENLKKSKLNSVTTNFDLRKTIVV